MNSERFKQQFLPFYPRLYRIAYVLLKNRQDAEDILQEAYCKLWSKKDELTDVINSEAFCVVLVKNLCRDFLRSSQSKRSETLTNDVPLQTMTTPETHLIKKDEVQYTQRLINRLPEKQRQVIQLRGIKDCSFEEIGEITGLREINIRALLSKARKTIREQYIRKNDE